MQAAHRVGRGWRFRRCRPFPESPIPRHERFQHVRNQRHGIDRFAVGLRVQRGVAVEVGFEAGRACEGQLDAGAGRQRSEPQFIRAHRDDPLLKNSGWYG